MSRIAYVNGRYMRHDLAKVHVEDRGYQFSDGVYEVAAVFGGRVIDEEPHLDRLERSLRELKMDLPIPRSALRLVTREVLRRNRCEATARSTCRSRAVRQRGIIPSPKGRRGAVVLTARPVQWPETAEADRGAEVVSIPDGRWGRCDVKSRLAASQRAGQAGRPRAGRLRGMVRRCARPGHGGIVYQCLDC